MSALQRRRLRVSGTVQGVGFRPFVFHLANSLGLTGFVLNDSQGVLIEAEGPPPALELLKERLLTEAPVLARVDSISSETITLVGGGTFEIRQSQDLGTAASPVSIDSATCPECLSEIDDPTNRRFRYPFTNCTNCGPRYTMVKSVPYDRPYTTMAGFKMCQQCQSEYDDPYDRRFHAQPNACPLCGPHLQLSDSNGSLLAERDEALSKTVGALLDGRIIAIKGIGGYHLAVDATNDEAVHLLRTRKGRFDKPFAVMVPDLKWGRTLCDLAEDHVKELSSIRRPIVIAPRAPNSVISEEVAPALGELGLFLPYTPLHHLMLKDIGVPLVMTSGNLSDDPIAFEDQDARTRLSGVADMILSHNRPIHIRCDDSVVKVTNLGPQLLRRARGYTPEIIRLSRPTQRHIVSVGAELKNTVAVAKEGFMVTSQHIGDLEHLSTYQSFMLTLDHLCRLYGVRPEVMVHDLHPEYISTKFASETDLELLGVQHHHSHIAACMLENNHTEPVIGIAFDGLGLGTDGTLWGGEWLLADLGGFERLAHLKEVPLPGGSKAIKEPWRMAVAWLVEFCSPDELDRRGSELNNRYNEIVSLMEKTPQPITSSMGRLFDCVAALLNVRSYITYEGQAAIELEALARIANGTQGPQLRFDSFEKAGQLIADPTPMLRGLLEGKDAGLPSSLLAASFHQSLINLNVEITLELAQKHNVDTVALSGGVFQNTLLSVSTTKELQTRGLRVLTHKILPPNDGGISAGQAAIAAWER